MCILNVDSGKLLASNVHAVAHNGDTVGTDLEQLIALAREANNGVLMRQLIEIRERQRAIARELYATWAEMASPSAVEMAAHDSTHAPHVIYQDATRSYIDVDPYAEKAAGHADNAPGMMAP